MEESVDGCPIARLLDHKDVVGEIMIKLGSTRSMISFSAVNSACLAAKKNPGLTTRFAEVNKAAFVGFLVEFKQLNIANKRKTRLIYHRASSHEESAVALRKKFKPGLIAEDTVLAANGGCVLTAGCGPEVAPKDYYISYPGDNPKTYTPVASTMPKVPKDGGQHTKNTYGQFGLMRKEGPSGISFFVKDWADYFVCSYAGAGIYKDEKIYIHVCELVDGTWIRHVSPPIDPAICALFHRNPYSVLHGDSLFLMYVIRFIVCLDLGSKTFSKIYLPDVVTERAMTWHDYTVCHHSKNGLAMIHYWGGMLYTWLLVSESDGGAWKLESTINLIEIFGTRIPAVVVQSMLAREEDPVGRCHYYTVQVRSASPDGRFVLLTVGFDPYMYMVDMTRKKVHKIAQQESDGPMGRVHALTEQWPPKA